MSVPAHWRLAVMFDAPGHDLPALETALRHAGAAVRAAAASNAVRIGVADRDPDLDSLYAIATGDRGRTVDGAIEITFPDEDTGRMAAIGPELRSILADFADMGSVEVMTGPMFPMVPVRSGGTFLSLAFRRDPAITSPQFRDWWLYRHAPMAIPVLGAGLRAYDQVHVNMAATARAAAAFGVPAVEYDAYDNLTWDDRYGFLDSCSDAAGMAALEQDEIGRIGTGTRRHALMSQLD